MSAILRNLQRRAVIQGLFREDVWEYPVEALREALVNALVHRDYSPLARGTPVQVRIFPDRLEIENPGGLFGPVTIDRLGDPGLLAARNNYLVHLLEDLPDEGGRAICENRGTGIPAMLEALRAAGMEPPRFEDRRTTFRLRFSNASLLDEGAVSWLNQFSAYNFSDAQRLALAYARREGKLAHADYRRLNPGLDSAEVTRQLAGLVRQGLLAQHGVRRWTYYTLAQHPTEQPDQLAEPVAQPTELAEKPIKLSEEPSQLPRWASKTAVRRAIVLLCSTAPVSAQELALHLRRNRFYLSRDHLAPLVAEGLLEREGTTPTDPNVRYRTTGRGRQWLAEQMPNH